MVAIVDGTKIVPSFDNRPVPVEIVRFGWEATHRKIAALGGGPKLRLGADGAPRITPVHTAANFSYQTEPAVGDRFVCVEPGDAVDCCGHDIVVKDVIADNFLQQVLMRPEDYDVIATLNLNGDYISDALAAQVGGIGIAPGANINYLTGHAIFEATHGTAPKYANQDKVNPGSVILSGVLMLRHLGYPDVASRVETAVRDVIADGTTVTHDLGGRAGAYKIGLVYRGLFDSGHPLRWLFLASASRGESYPS